MYQQNYTSTTSKNAASKKEKEAKSKSKAIAIIKYIGTQPGLRKKKQYLLSARKQGSKIND
jgi:hypothetical protein